MLMPSIFGDKFGVDLFDDFFPYRKLHTIPDQTPIKTDIKDLGDHYELEMDLPGFGKDDIQAELKEGYLTVSAEKNTSNDEKDEEGRYIRRERYSGKYQRSFFVGKHVTQEDIQASFKDGVLGISFPKEEAKPRVEEKKLIEIQ